MTNAFKSIKQSLTEAIGHAKTKDTEATGVKLYLPQLLTVKPILRQLVSPAYRFAKKGGGKCVARCATTAWR